MRCNARMDIFRSHGLFSEALGEHVGLKINTRSMAAYLTETFCHELFCRNKEDLLTACAVTNMCHLDSLLSAVAAPYSLISGSTKDFLPLCFTSPNTFVCIKVVENAICYYISKCNLPKIGGFLRWSPARETICQPSFLQLNKLTTANLFWVLLLA